ARWMIVHQDASSSECCFSISAINSSPMKCSGPAPSITRRSIRARWSSARSTVKHDGAEKFCNWLCFRFRSFPRVRESSRSEKFLTEADFYPSLPIGRFVEPLRREREDLDAGFSHADRVLALRGERAIARHHRPAVGQYFDVRPTELDHRIDGEEHARLEHDPGARSADMHDIRLIMK